MAHGGTRTRALPYEYQGHVVSNPRAELAVDNAKYIKACTELHLADRNIEFIWGFDRFVNLEELWLNDNKIEALDNLDANFRLKKVYAHNNRITTVRNTLQHCKFLDTLILSNNAITDLKETVSDLEGFQYLHNLELLGNPLAEEPNYRLYVIFKLPSLHVFDRHVVTQDERLAAARKFGKRRGAGKRKAKGAGKGGAARALGASQRQPLSTCEADLAREVRYIQAEMEANERAELEKAYSAGVRSQPQNTMLRSAAMTMSRSLLAAEADMAAARDEAKRNEPRPTLSEWEVVQFTQIFKQFDTNKSGTISRVEFRRALDEAEDMGKSLTIDKDGEAMDRYFAAMDTSGDGEIGLKEFMAALQGELFDADGNQLEPMQFKDMQPDQAKKRSEHLFKQAAAIQAELLPMPDDDPRRPALQRKAFKLSEKAGRLADKHFEAQRAKRAAPKATARHKPRSDYVTFISTVRVRRDPQRNAAVTAIDSGSDSDSDDEEGKAPTAKVFEELRQRRRGRKPRRVMQSSVTL